MSAQFAAQSAGMELGNPGFKKDHGVEYAYMSGSMYRGIASPQLVVRMAKAKMLGFFGTAGLSMAEIKTGIQQIRAELKNGESFGLNLICNIYEPEVELETVRLYLSEGIQRVEASAFMEVTPALALYHLKGLSQGDDGRIQCNNKIIAKLSRPEVAQAFMSPVSQRLVAKWLSAGEISEQQAEWSKQVPVSRDICVEADSGGHTDRGLPAVLLPAIQRLARDLEQQYDYDHALRIGAAGGIGTPQGAAAAFVMGADFILTGSINQCTVEAGMSDVVKDMLQTINVQDTDYAPAGDMFEIGAKVQVLKKGVFFPARANKLHTLYSQYDALEQIPAKVRGMLEKQYFQKSLDEVWQDTQAYFIQSGQVAEVEKAKRDAKHKMALMFRSYLALAMRAAFAGETARKVDFQVHTGPALGAFNQWVKGTDLEDWRHRHADEIGKKLMSETSALLHNMAKSIL